MKIQKVRTASIALALVCGVMGGALPPASAATTDSVNSSSATSIAPSLLSAAQSDFNTIQDQRIGSSQWNKDIAKLKAEGILTESTDQYGNLTYTVHDKNNKAKTLGSFTIQGSTASGKSDSVQIGGTWVGIRPAVVFNQNDQRALKAGGAAGVTAMAAAWAAALSETVIGSVISAGLIASIGGTAAYYLSQNGICSRNRNLILPIGGSPFCR